MLRNKGQSFAFFYFGFYGIEVFLPNLGFRFRAPEFIRRKGAFIRVQAAPGVTGSGGETGEKYE